MAYLQRSEQLEQALVKPEWDGVESSLHFMKQAFSKVVDSVSREKPLPNSTKPLQELIQQALLEIAHTVDAQFDSLNAKCEKLEGKLEKAQKKTEAIAKATAQENLRMDEAAVDVFA